MTKGITHMPVSRVIAWGHGGEVSPRAREGMNGVVNRA